MLIAGPARVAGAARVARGPGPQARATRLPATQAMPSGPCLSAHRCQCLGLAGSLRAGPVTEPPPLMILSRTAARAAGASGTVTAR